MILSVRNENGEELIWSFNLAVASDGNEISK